MFKEESMGYNYPLSTSMHVLKVTVQLNPKIQLAIVKTKVQYVINVLL